MEEQVQGTVDNQAEPQTQQGPDVSQTASETVQAATPEAEAERWERLSELPVNEWNLKPEELDNPKFTETLENIRKNQMLQSDYTRKTQELAELRKQLWDPKAKNFSDADIMELLNNPSFVNVAQSLINNQAKGPDLENMTEGERQLYEAQQKLQSQAQTIQQQLQQQQAYTYKQQLAAELKMLDTKYDKAVSPIIDKIEAVRVGATNPNTPLTVEGAFKALYFEDYGKSMYEKGKQEGMGIKDRKLNNQPISGLPLANAKPQNMPKSIKEITDYLKNQHR